MSKADEIFVKNIEDILQNDDYDGEVDGADKLLGKNQVYFLPYLMGERSPHNDTSARGAFIGMRANTTRREMSVAVLEGVAFALRDCVEAARRSGIEITRATVCGGGAKSALWKKIIANVLNIEICSPETEEGAAYGSALLAMVGAGAVKSISDVKNFVAIKETIKPDGALASEYNRRYETFKKLYPALKECFELI